MKKNILFSIFTIATGVVLMSNSGGRAADNAVDSTGRVAANQTCQQCHNGGAFGAASVTIAITDANGLPATYYTPTNSIYHIRVTITSATVSQAAGFQAVVVTEQNTQAQAGTLTAVSSNTQITPLNGLQYAEHRAPSTTKTFDFDWISPSSSFGRVKIFVAGTAVNLNGTSGGDSATGATSAVLEDGSVATENENASSEKLAVLENPVHDFLNLKASNLENGDYTVQIFDISGKIIFSKNQVFSQKDNFVSIDTHNFSNGIYVVALSQKNKNLASLKFIK